MGADSWATLLRHEAALSHLVFVEGFDLPIDETDRCMTFRALAQQAADKRGKQLINIRTNLRKLTDPICHWGHHQFGSALAAVSHLLENDLGEIHIASGYHLHNMQPHPSHPSLDPMWSGQAILLRHDGWDMTRSEKLSLIVNDSHALTNLRVCFKQHAESLNCGTCFKCVFSGLFPLAGLTGHSQQPSFPHPLTPTLISRVKIEDPLATYCLKFREQEICDLPHAHNFRQEVAAMRRLRRKHAWRHMRRSLSRRIRGKPI